LDTHIVTRLVLASPELDKGEEDKEFKMHSQNKFDFGSGVKF
jgi:hypothetical protein